MQQAELLHFTTAILAILSHQESARYGYEPSLSFHIPIVFINTLLKKSHQLHYLR